MIDYDKIFSKFPVIETKNLILDQFTENDILSYYQMCQHPDYIMEFIPEGLILSFQDAIGTITQKYPQSFKARQDLTWVIVLKGSNPCIIGLRDLFIDSPYEPAVTQGFITVGHRNKGYNQEILKAVISFLKNANVEQLVFNCNANNEAVKHIAKKMKFQDITSIQSQLLGTRKKFILNL